MESMEEEIKYREPLRVEYLNPLPVMRRSPCHDCGYRRKDKNETPCLHCQKAYMYDLILSGREIVREKLVSPGGEGIDYKVGRKRRIHPPAVVEMAIRLRQEEGMTVTKIRDILLEQHEYLITLNALQVFLGRLGIKKPQKAFRRNASKSAPLSQIAKNRVDVLMRLRRSKNIDPKEIAKELRSEGINASAPSVAAYIMERR